MSALTGESQPALRTAMPPAGQSRLIDAGDIVFSGTVCLSGDARAFVFATGMHTEIGRIAALSQRRGPGDSPLERQVRRVAWLIAVVATAAGVPPQPTTRAIPSTVCKARRAPISPSLVCRLCDRVEQEQRWAVLGHRQR
jgi:hypothetical protein